MAGKEGRTFLREIVSQKYGLGEFRRAQLDADRVRGDEVVVDDASVGHSGDSASSRTWWRIGPGDEPFLTQTMQVHFVELPPHSSNHGHGHQNEAVFYILEGRGYEEHDAKQYRWEKDDLVVVHTDSVHRHFNDSDEKAVALVMKAKSMWMYFGLVQQQKSGPKGAPDPAPVPDEERFGPREDWSQIWTPGVEDKPKVISGSKTEWQHTRDGKIKVLSSPEVDFRCHSVDVYVQEIAGGSRSAKHWHMADEVLYIKEGSGYSLHWEVEAEIADKFYARVAKEPTRHEFTAGDTVYIPQNTIHQHFADDGAPVTFISAQNRLFRNLGYDTVAYLEDAPAPAAEAEKVDAHA
jgi:quercetin dioxygenase-like cupin family protein